MRQISGVNIYKEVTCMTNYREILRLHREKLNVTFSAVMADHGEAGHSVNLFVVIQDIREPPDHLW